jgi:hypothetical protein
LLEAAAARDAVCGFGQSSSRKVLSSLLPKTVLSQVLTTQIHDAASPLPHSSPAFQHNDTVHHKLTTDVTGIGPVAALTSATHIEDSSASEAVAARRLTDHWSLLELQALYNQCVQDVEVCKRASNDAHAAALKASFSDACTPTKRYSDSKQTLKVAVVGLFRLYNVSFSIVLMIVMLKVLGQVLL